MHHQKKKSNNRSSKRGEQKRGKIMKERLNEIEELQYRIQRYQAMGNGVMCQTLKNRLQKLLAQQVYAA